MVSIRYFTAMSDYALFYDDSTISSASERESNLLVDNLFTKTLNSDPFGIS